MNEEEKEIFIKFGQNIRALREEGGITIQELSKLIGIRVQYLKKIEAGKAYGMSSSYILIFAKVFKIKPYDVVKGI